MKLAISFITGVMTVVTILVLWYNSINSEGFVWGLICMGTLIMFTVLLTAESIDRSESKNNNTPEV